MHLRGLLKQAAEQYEETGAYKRLQELAARVDAAQQAASQAAVQQ